MTIAFTYHIAEVSAGLLAMTPYRCAGHHKQEYEKKRQGLERSMAERLVIRAPIGQGLVCYRHCHSHQHLPLTFAHHQIRPAHMFERDLGLVKHPRTRRNGKRLLETLCLAFSSRVRSSRSHQQYLTRTRGAMFHSILLHHSDILIFGQSFFCRT